MLKNLLLITLFASPVFAFALSDSDACLTSKYTVGQLTCLDGVFGKSEQNLNQSYQDMIASLIARKTFGDTVGNSSIDAFISYLRVSEGTWAIFRDAQCTLEANARAINTLIVVTNLTCQIRMADERVQSLKTLVDGFVVRPK